MPLVLPAQHSIVQAVPGYVLWTIHSWHSQNNNTVSTGTTDSQHSSVKLSTLVYRTVSTDSQSAVSTDKSVIVSN